MHLVVSYHYTQLLCYKISHCDTLLHSHWYYKPAVFSYSYSLNPYAEAKILWILVTVIQHYEAAY